MTDLYITTSIPYVNGAPHLGHALEFVHVDAFLHTARDPRHAPGCALSLAGLPGGRGPLHEGLHRLVLPRLRAVLHARRARRRRVHRAPRAGRRGHGDQLVLPTVPLPRPDRRPDHRREARHHPGRAPQRGARFPRGRRGGRVGVATGRPRPRLGHPGAGRSGPGLPPPTRILVHDYLTVNGTKIAKSGAQAACPPELVASYGADAVRWWLLRAPAPAAITDFTVERLVAAHDRDLANTLGNLASRVLTLARREAHWRTPARAAEVDADLRAQAAALPTAVDDAVDRYDVRGACAAIVALAAAGNRFLETEAAWQLARRAEAGDVPAARRFVAVIDAAERLPRRRRR